MVTKTPNQHRAQAITQPGVGGGGGVGGVLSDLQEEAVAIALELNLVGLAEVQVDLGALLPLENLCA